MSTNTTSNEITSVCTNYQELLQSEDFKRVVRIAISQSGCFNEEAIMSIFEKLGKAEELSEQEKINLISFADNKNVEDAVTPILAKLSESLLPGTQNLEQHTSFGEFLEGIFAEDGFKTTMNGILELAGIDVSDRVSDTLKLSSEAQEVQKKFHAWLGDNSDYKGIEKIKQNVTITNDGIKIQTKLGLLTLFWKNHIFRKVKVIGDKDLQAQPYTIEKLGAIMVALGGKELRLKDGHKVGGPEISSFLLEVANIESGRFYWSSSRHESSDLHAWGLGVGSDEVYVSWVLRSHDLSSLSS